MKAVKLKLSRNLRKIKSEFLIFSCQDSRIFYRSSRLKMFFKIDVLENFTNFAVYWSPFLIKVQALATLLKRDSNIPVNFVKFFRTPFYRTRKKTYCSVTWYIYGSKLSFIRKQHAFFIFRQLKFNTYIVQIPNIYIYIYIYIYILHSVKLRAIHR